MHSVRRHVAANNRCSCVLLLLAWPLLLCHQAAAVLPFGVSQRAGQLSLLRRDLNSSLGIQAQPSAVPQELPVDMRFPCTDKAKCYKVSG